MRDTTIERIESGYCKKNFLFTSQENGRPEEGFVRRHRKKVCWCQKKAKQYLLRHLNMVKNNKMLNAIF